MGFLQKFHQDGLLNCFVWDCDCFFRSIHGWKNKKFSICQGRIPVSCHDANGYSRHGLGVGLYIFLQWTNQSFQYHLWNHGDPCHLHGDTFLYRFASDFPNRPETNGSWVWGDSILSETAFLQAFLKSYGTCLYAHDTWYFYIFFFFNNIFFTNFFFRF